MFGLMKIDLELEQSLEQRIKMERRKIFWRLHFLPWITIVVLLLYAFIQRDRRYRSELHIATDKAHAEGVLSIQTQAIQLDYASWGLDVRGEPTFQWTEGLSSMEILERELDNAAVTQGIPLAAYPDLRGFNLQKTIVRACTKSITDVFDGLETYGRMMKK